MPAKSYFLPYIVVTGCLFYNNLLSYAFYCMNFSKCMLYFTI